MSIKIKHSIIKQYIIGHLKVEGHRVVSCEFSKNEEITRLSIFVSENAHQRGMAGGVQRSNRNFCLKFHEDC